MDALQRLYRSDRVAWADVLAGLDALAGCDPQYVPALARWIKGERWKDERPAGRAPPHRPPPRNTALEGLNELERRFTNGQQQQPTPLRIAG